MTLPAAPVPGTKISGKLGSFEEGSTNYNCSKWTFQDKNNILNVTDTSSQGYITEIGGQLQGSGTIEFFYDSTAPPSGSLFTAGVAITNLKLLVGAGTAMGLSCPIANVESFEISMDVNDAVKCTLSYRTSGAYTYVVV